MSYDEMACNGKMTENVQLKEINKKLLDSLREAANTLGFSYSKIYQQIILRQVNEVIKQAEEFNSNDREAKREAIQNE